jgi:hypothetical protein
LWSLETLAWSPDYLAPATAVLARLAALDPQGSSGNRPSNSLRRIYLLWHPQTNASLQERLAVLNRLRKKEPQVAWDLILDLYPKAHDIGHNAPVPRWRDFSVSDPEPVTRITIRKGAEQLGLWLLEDVAADATRWAQVIKRFSDFAPDLRQKFIEKLAALPAVISDDGSRAQIQDSLRRFIHHHREFATTEWALPEAELSALERVYHKLDPRDPIKRSAWLFELQTPPLLNPIGHDWRANENAADDARRDAVKTLFEKDETEGIFKLADAVGGAGYIGKALAEIADADELEEIFLRALNSEKQGDRDVAHGIIVAKSQEIGEVWGDQLIDRALRETWPDDAIARILLSLPKTERFMRRAATVGGEIEASYWRQVASLWFSPPEGLCPWVIEKLIGVGRARDAVHLAGRNLQDVPNDLHVRVLTEAVSAEPSRGDDGNEATMFRYSVEEILQKLDAASDVSKDQIARLEWSYLKLLEYSRRPPKMLHGLLATSPEFFVEVLSAIYRSNRPDEEEQIPEGEERERRAAIASNAFTLLNSWRLVPGLADRRIDAEALARWVSKARELCEKAGRKEIGEQKIGEILAHAPDDSDGTWPCLEVRDVIEAACSSHIESGLLVGIHNKRGVTTRSPTDGGAQERDLALTYRRHAKAIRMEWPRTAAALEKIASSYDFHAKEHDADAERIQW